MWLQRRRLNLVRYSYPEYSKNWYLKNKERISERYHKKKHTSEFKIKKNKQRIRYMNLWKSKVFKILGESCVNCGFSDKRALQIDHINGDGYLENRKRNAAHYRKVVESVLREEKRYQILCCNCNWIKRHENNEHKHRGNNDNEVCEVTKPEVTLFPLQNISSNLYRQGVS